jgi:hypothetical protein
MVRLELQQMQAVWQLFSVGLLCADDPWLNREQHLFGVHTRWW